MKKLFKLHSCCIPVKGVKISIICDIQRNEFHYIPNELYDILNVKTIDIEELLSNQDPSERETLKEYFEFLIEKEYAVMTDIPEAFPELSNHFETPEIINNAIIDVSVDSSHDYSKILEELENLGCKFLEIRIFDKISLEEIKSNILNHCENSRLRGITIYLPYFEGLSNELIYNEIISKFPVIDNFILHSSPSISRSEDIRYQKILFHTAKISSEKHCGVIGKSYFRINNTTFFEGQHKNTCLNKKISICKKGLIRNCPSMKGDFGDHKLINLKDVVFQSKYLEKSNIVKDQIETCKVCQFRYICTDCRAYIEYPKDDFSKPLKCGYDPYNNIWEDWSKLPHKQKAIKMYELADIED